MERKIQSFSLQGSWSEWCYFCPELSKFCTIRVKEKLSGEYGGCCEQWVVNRSTSFAKERARSKKSSIIPTRQIEIVVGNGEGRATREFEVIWWPDLFSDNRHGKLTLQIYYFFLKWYFDLATNMFLKHFQRCVIHSLVDLSIILGE